MPAKAKKPVSRKRAVAKKAPVARAPLRAVVKEDSLTKYLPFMVGVSFFALFLAVIVYAVALKSQWLASQDAALITEKSSPAVNSAKTLPALPKN
jgi:hypothetical protein